MVKTYTQFPYPFSALAIAFLSHSFEIIYYTSGPAGTDVINKNVV